MLYIIRHGKTDWNKERKLQGKSDIPLNDEGRKMARLAGIEYSGVHFDVCYSSPLIRARETAGLFFENRDVPIITDERLTEMGFGIYEGAPNCFLSPDCPIYVLFNEPEKYTASDGAESLQSLLQRTGDFLDKVIYPQIENGKDILIVGHGAMNSAIVNQIKKLPLSQFWCNGLEQCKLIKLL